MDSKFNTETKQSVYDIVTNRIITLLENGTIPWKKPWIESGFPQNLISKRPYRGVNVLLLTSLGYEKNFFLTFDQVRKANGKVRRGEHGHIVVFYSVRKRISTDKSMEEEKPKWILKYYRVFNVEQCEFPKELTLPPITRQNDPIVACESVIRNCPGSPRIQHNTPEAYYSPISDYINMPQIGFFNNSETYYDALFHELIHWSGHDSRLNRAGIVDIRKRTSKSYSFEELIAQLGASFLSNHTGILPPVIENSVAYIAGWLEVLRNDKRLILKASAAAQRATDYILQTNLEDPSTIEQSEMIVLEE